MSNKLSIVQNCYKMLCKVIIKTIWGVDLDCMNPDKCDLPNKVTLVLETPKFLYILPDLTDSRLTYPMITE